MPPKAIFPEPKDSPDGRDYRDQLITVPSCAVHNSANSKDDEYLLYIATMSIDSNALGTHHFLTKVRRAIEEKPSLIDRIVANVERVSVADPRTGAETITYAFSANTPRLTALFERIARGIYFHESKHRWTGSVTAMSESEISLDDHEANDDREFIRLANDRLFRDIPHKGRNPEAFTYQRLLAPDGEHMIRMHFYGAVRAIATLAG